VPVTGLGASDWAVFGDRRRREERISLLLSY